MCVQLMFDFLSFPAKQVSYVPTLRFRLLHQRHYVVLNNLQWFPDFEGHGLKG